MISARGSTPLWSSSAKQQHIQKYLIIRHGEVDDNSVPCCRGGSRGLQAMPALYPVLPWWQQVQCVAHPPRRRRTSWQPLRFHPLVAIAIGGDLLATAGSTAAALGGEPMASRIRRRRSWRGRLRSGHSA